MKKTILMLATAMALMMPAVAQQTASLWWGYGNGQDYWKGVGGGANSSTQTAAIRVPADVVASYAGSRIKAIRFAVNSGTGSATNVSYFLTSSLESIPDQDRVSAGTLTSGWHTFEMPTPYQITTGAELYIGYTATGVRPIAIVDEPGTSGTCWMTSGKKFYDYGAMEGYNYTLAVQALIESDNFEASLSFAEAGDVKSEPHGGFVPLTVKSLTPVDVTSYTISLKVDGESVGQKSAVCNLDELGATHSIELPLPDLSLGQHTYEAEITEINGKAQALGVKTDGKLEVLKYVMYRTHVVEECTGTWCGYCVSGIVALNEMRKNHPKRFIGIAVHGKDSYAVASYNPLINRISGYPSAFFNRNLVVDPKPSEMEIAFQRANELSDCEIKILGVEYTSAARNQVKVYMRYRFDANHDKIDYRVALVTIEDYISDIQSNYYAGGGMGPMGGFEHLGSHVRVDLMDVARDITSYTGIVNSVPAQLEEGVWYDYVYTYNLPYNIANRQNISIIALLQNAAGTEILNAAKCEEIHEQGTLGIEATRCDASASTTCFDLFGRPAATGKGLRIRDGKVVMER